MNFKVACFGCDKEDFFFCYSHLSAAQIQRATILGLSKGLLGTAQREFDHHDEKSAQRNAKYENKETAGWILRHLRHGRKPIFHHRR